MTKCKDMINEKTMKQSKLAGKSNITKRSKNNNHVTGPGKFTIKSNVTGWGKRPKIC